MMAILIDGKQTAADIRAGLKQDIASLVNECGKKPCLAVVLIGDNPASQVYVRNKVAACAELGIESREVLRDASITEDELLSILAALNTDPAVNGILVQLPLPKHIDEKKVLYSMDPAKDVDGFHPFNIGRMMIGDTDVFLPCTPFGCQELISRVMPDTAGKHLVVVGRSNIVGKPMANMMVQKNRNANCIVTICHTAAPDLSVYTRQADILVAACGVPRFITAPMVKDGVVVIDVGMNRIDDVANPGKTRLVGDVDFDAVKDKALAITPVPGGVGPMTIAMLMKNTVRAFRIQNGM
jgi:methylenetetrahydrofolate dehydrogenase (NADP+) / methenyltetrahydrofolate cyclohydrolase